MTFRATLAFKAFVRRPNVISTCRRPTALTRATARTARFSQRLSTYDSKYDRYMYRVGQKNCILYSCPYLC